MNGARCDVVVIGAGMVGATLASLLCGSGFSVAMVEPRKPETFSDEQDVGLRVSAISPGSAAVLNEAGVWRRTCAQRARPYRRMQVEDGHSGEPLVFDAPAHNLERLGTIVENDLLQWTLWQHLESHGEVEIHCPDAFAGIDRRADGNRVTLESGRAIDAGLVVAADGAASMLRRAIGIGQAHWSYNQHGLVAVVAKARANPGVAWQRFLPGGPLAFLPLADGRSSIVWTLPSREARDLLEAGDDEFIEQLDAASRGWLGSVTATGPRAAFPLSMRLSEHYAQQGIVLVGDAAHVVHPLAGQGVNLGFADAAALTEILIRARRAGDRIGSARVLEKYDRWRRSESQLMSFGMHALHGLFSADASRPLRRAGLALVRRSWFLRDQFVRRAAGLGPNAPSLASGTRLQAMLLASSAG